jgi:hypothetical protein
MTFHVPEKYRIRAGRLGSDATMGNSGAFHVKLRHGQLFFVIASDGGNWEHVSISRTDRCPTWDEMCQVKAMFWDADDCVVQFHPPESDYVNNHPYCLHLWRHVDVEFPRPPAYMVGVKEPA